MKILMKTNIPIISDLAARLGSAFSGVNGAKRTAAAQKNALQSTEAKKSSSDALILRRQQGAVIKNGYVSLALKIVVIIIAAYFIFSQLFLFTQVNGNGMFPAMKDGDLVIGFRLQQSYMKGDVVVYERGGEYFVGRIAAREGDFITISSNGSMMVNGTIQTGEIMYPTYAKEGVEYPFEVPAGCVFILGDYRTQSEDSRDFGAVPLDDIAGKVITVLRRRSL